MSSEKWIAIPGWADYEASNHGRIRRATSRTNTCVGRILMGSVNRQGYIRVKLNGRRVAFAHRLVALAFLGASSKPHVNHINCVKDDNRPENLEYATAAENQKHASRHGRLCSGDRHPARRTTGYRDRLNAFRLAHPERMARGERVNTAKVTTSDVVEIRRLVRNGATQQSVADTYGLTQSAVSAIASGRHWKHVPLTQN